MALHITQVEYLTAYQVAVTFNSGERGIADLTSMVQTGVFQPLAEKFRFGEVALDDELETVAWPGGLELAPEFVYFQAFKADSARQAQFKQWGYVD